jgi:hypothetical protein
MQAADLAERRPGAEHAVPVDAIDLRGCKHDCYRATADRIAAALFQHACVRSDHANTRGTEATV